MAWQKGPLPPKTYHWGAVVTKDMLGAGGGGFVFADFRGDHVILVGDVKDVRVEAADVAWFNNSIELAPTDQPEK